MSWKRYWITLFLCCVAYLAVRLLVDSFFDNPMDPRNDKYSTGACP